MVKLYRPISILILLLLSHCLKGESSSLPVDLRTDHLENPIGIDNQTEFMARFNYKGFRYVEVTASNTVELNKNSLTAYFMHSDVLPKGKIETSSDLINKLWRAANNAYLSNLMGYPTDCPQREKNGWTGDGHFECIE
jgi:alpha-L-rhamnosidase